MATTEASSYRRLPPEWNGIVPTRVFLEEATRIVEKSKGAKITVRVMGGVGIALHSSNETDFAQRLGRLVEGKQEYTDLDFMGLFNQRNDMTRFFAELNYTMRKTTLTSATSRRQIYFHPDGYFTVDVFMDKLLVANHPMDLKPRLDIDPLTIPLADLLLEKIQMWVSFSEKDLKDCMLLIRAHGISDDGSENEMINSKYIAKLLANDWGFYYTATSNLRKIADLVKNLDQVGKDLRIDPSKISTAEREDVASKIEHLLKIIEAEPKSFGWKMRSKVGTSSKWYNDVETPESTGGFGIWQLREVSK